MRNLITATVLVVATAASTAAFAGDRLSDTQFIKASYCRGLVSDEASAAGLDALLKANERGRAPFVADRAKEARGDGRRQLRRAGGDVAQAEIASQLSGPCAVFMG